MIICVLEPTFHEVSKITFLYVIISSNFVIKAFMAVFLNTLYLLCDITFSNTFCLGCVNGFSWRNCH